MSASDIMRIVLKSSFSNIHELTDKEIDEMFDNESETKKEEYYKKRGNNGTTADKIEVVQEQINKIYKDYYYILDLGLSEKMLSNNQKISFSEIKCYLWKDGEGLIRVTDYLTKLNSQMILKESEQRGDFPEKTESRFSFSITPPLYPYGTQEIVKKVRTWRELELIFKKIDLSKVN